MKKSKLTVNSTNKGKASPPSPGNACGSLASTNTKANGEKNGIAVSDDKGGQVPSTAGEVARLLLKLHAQKQPSAADLNLLRQGIVATPEAWPFGIVGPQSIRTAIIEKLHGTGVMSALVLAEFDILKQQLEYETAPALERMQIDHLLTAWLRLRDAEIQFSHCMNGDSVNVVAARFRQDFLESAQARFLRASEALARIRRLARNTPALQINIAHDGSKQVNMQGEVAASRETAKTQS